MGYSCDSMSEQTTDFIVYTDSLKVSESRCLNGYQPLYCQAVPLIIAESATTWTETQDPSMSFQSPYQLGPVSKKVLEVCLRCLYYLLCLAQNTSGKRVTGTLDMSQKPTVYDLTHHKDMWFLSMIRENRITVTMQLQTSESYKYNVRSCFK